MTDPVVSSSSNYFYLKNVSLISDIPTGSSIHIMGVAGVAMAQLAIELSGRGYRVSGSDQSFYEPTGSLLRSSSIDLKVGYRADNIPDDCRLVIIGNAISSGNDEVLEVARRKLPFSLFPKALYEMVIKGRTSLVISGTHGKSTTSALTAFLLESVGLRPSYFIGGKVQQLSVSLRSDAGKYSVVEGDEYDSAFFAKLPKFHFYSPDVLLITSIEYDHADIYPDEAAIENEFKRLIDSMPVDGVVVACSEGGGILERIRSYCRDAKRLKFATYGYQLDDDYRVERKKLEGECQTILLTHGTDSYKFNLRIGGAYNALNAAGACAVLREAGAPIREMLPFFGEFKGVMRRQEVVIDNPTVKIIEDFAHHPTAVKATLAGIREDYPKRRIVVLFEPRSNTSRRAVFQNQYAESFEFADLVIVSDVIKREIDQGVDLLDTKKLSDDLSKKGVSACSASDPQEVFRSYLAQHIRGDLVVIMSNGGFGGILQQLKDWALEADRAECILG